MKLLVLLLLFLALLPLEESSAQAVKYQTDQHIINLQQRMVFKQWDRRKFTPTKGFLGLNPNYWITWGLHPNYPKTDHRPLSATGPQSQRLLLVAAMKNTEVAYSKHTDTLKNLALSETAGYLGALSTADPLWQLYYRNEFKPLIEPTNPLQGSSIDVQNYLYQTGLLEWYSQEIDALTERLNSTRTTNMERGARIMQYHRMLQEFRQLLTTWESKKQRAELYLKISKSNRQIKEFSWSSAAEHGKTDRQIAEDILSKSKL